ncbi:metal-dependent hydrolase [Anoxybacillus flavithermus NBRC 109594]|uniref:Metal-dependent hydrolase n=1 Tax=Anoxybacillus flavithermus NBRC 109594 TaxID=1315967 RepID=R4FZK9_9BACL|nr:MBL fold metallo-hydrolase [Anoxybacillus flavithermus]GAC90223.1 metal-dependent hydrolase [Anoxybacillus flavithermus NBRC 109594]
MKVTVIGYWGAFPKKNEATSCYLVEHDGFHLLVDCGSGALAQLQNVMDIEQIDAVIVSHYHHDHVADIGPLQYARLIKKNLGVDLPELPIYGHSLDRDGFARLAHKGVTKAVAYDPNETLHIGPFTISFMRTEHPAICYAMRITAGGKTVVYTADSSYLPQFVPFAKQAHLLICECNFYAGQNAKQAGHMTSEEAATIARDAEVETLLLTHLPHFGNVEQLVDEAKTIFHGDVQLAKTRWTWEG